MNIRRAVRAGSFYEDAASSCRLHASKLLEQASSPEDLPKTLYGGLVPHAGWVYSGRVAAMTLNALAGSCPLETVVLFGADHSGTAREGELFDSGVWQTPLGEVTINQALAAAILQAGGPIRANPRAHEYEHSLEVQVPLLQMLNPQVRIVPIEVPPSAQAQAVGQAVGRVLREGFPGVRVIGSTDLTHHGGHFPAPGGHGVEGVRWTEANDLRMIEIAQRMDAPAVIAEAQQHHNACGAGAIAATIAACRELGATRGVLLDYTHSYNVVHGIYPHDPDDTTVGYASIVFA